MRLRARTFSYEGAPIVIVAAFALAFIWLAEARQAGNDMAQAVASTTERNENLAIALEQFTIRTLQSADALTRLLKSGTEGGDAKSSLTRIVASGMLDGGLLQGAGVLDEFGRVMTSTSQLPSNANYSDRRYFRAHSEADTGLLMIGQPMVSRRLGEPSIPISRRINKPDGSFGGVAVVQVSPKRFSELYKSANLTGEDFIAVVGLDGIIRVRRTGNGETTGEDYSRSNLFRDQAKQPFASVKGPGMVDGVERYVSFRSLPDYRLIVVVGVTEANALRGYMQQRRINLAVAAAVSGLVMLLSLISSLFIRGRARDASKLRASEERLRLALQAGRMFAWERNPETDIVTRSGNAKDLIGLGSGPASEFLSRVHSDDRAKVPEILSGNWGADGSHNEVRFICPDGKIIWLSARSVEIDEPGKPKRMVGVTFDITDRKNAEAEVWRLANQDSLTGLSNRRHFQQCFDEALSAARQNGTAVTLLLLDVDDFKNVNDTLGHDAGDAVLRETAQRLQRLVRECDTVARIAGDEFAIVLVEPLRFEHGVRFADYVLDELRKPFSYSGRLVTCKATIGIAGFPDHDSTSLELIKDADIALYRGKADGRNRALAYGPQMKVAAERRSAICGEVREALRAGQIVPFYQPKVCLSSGRVVGFEALARWQHPERGVMTPEYFGVAFEDAALSELIGEAMMRQVPFDIAQWLSVGLECGRVAVNLSSAEFRQHGLASSFLSALSEAGVPTANFEVEVTETVFLGADACAVERMLQQFRAAGVSVALDDFGTGFASLSHLKQFPVDHIKIDQSFVRGLPDSADDEAIVGAVVALGRNLGMRVTAEGVETEQQAARLLEKGCSFGQGCLYAKPMVATRVPWFIERANGSGAALFKPSDAA